MRSGALIASHIAVMPPSERPAKCARSMLEVVEQLDDVAADVVDRVRAGRRLGAAVAARVVADEPEALGERARLRVPHLQRRAERVREDEHGRVLGAGDGVERDHRFSSARSTRAAAAPVSLRRRGCAHAVGVDLEAFEARAQPGRGGAGRGQEVGAAGATRCARRRRRARAPAPSRRAASRRARAPAGRSRARRSRRPGCACAASRSSRRRRASRTSPTSVWASSVTSRAALPTAPAATPSAPASSPIRPRSVCQGISGASRPRSAARCEFASAALPGCEPVPTGAAELRRPSAARCGPGSVGGLVELDHPARGLQPERGRLRLLQQRAADDRRVAVRLARASPPRRPRRAGRRAAGPARAW